MIRNLLEMYVIEIENRGVKVSDGVFRDYLLEKNKLKTDKNEKLLLIKNKLSEVISLLSIEKDEIKKKTLELEYTRLLKKVKELEE